MPDISELKQDLTNQINSKNDDTKQLRIQSELRYAVIHECLLDLLTPETTYNPLHLAAELGDDATITSILQATSDNLEQEDQKTLFSAIFDKLINPTTPAWYEQASNSADNNELYSQIVQSALQHNIPVIEAMLDNASINKSSEMGRPENAYKKNKSSKYYQAVYSILTELTNYNNANKAINPEIITQQHQKHIKDDLATTSFWGAKKYYTADLAKIGKAFNKSIQHNNEKAASHHNKLTKLSDFEGRFLDGNTNDNGTPLINDEERLNSKESEENPSNSTTPPYTPPKL